MNNNLQGIKDRMSDLIHSTCNTIGCKECPYKWPKDSEGNSCQSDYLMMLKYKAKKEGDSL